MLKGAVTLAFASNRDTLILICWKKDSMMKTMLNIVVASGLALSLGACKEKEGDAAATNVPPGPIAPPAGTQWTETVTKTADGGYLMGNPNAPVKLIEYGSLTCHVCADFETQGGKALRENYVKTGRVSYEFRNFIRDPIDATAAVLSRCGQPVAFFGLTEGLFTDQKTWFADRVPAVQDAMGKTQGTEPGEAAKLYLTATGLDTWFQQRGVSADQQKQCLANKAAFEEVVKITEDGNAKYTISGTPTFILNGKKVDVTAWTALEPMIKGAGGGI